jgi:hypothetical protein
MRWETQMPEDESKGRRQVRLPVNDRHDETQEPYHSASLGDSGASSTRIKFSVHTTQISASSVARARIRSTSVQKQPAKIGHHSVASADSSLLANWI